MAQDEGWNSSNPTGPAGASQAGLGAVAVPSRGVGRKTRDTGSAAAAGRPPRHRLDGRQKAAVIVRLLLSEGTALPLHTLSDTMQSDLTEAIGSMRLVDRATLHDVAHEFMEMLDQIGLSFPDGIDGAMQLLDGQLSDAATMRLRRIAGERGLGDPWARLEAQTPEVLAPLVQAECLEVGAVMLSKLSIAKAAALLEKLPPDLAQKLALAVARTERIAPDVVARIGTALAEQVSAQPPKAFRSDPPRRVGAILDATQASLRDSVLAALDAADADFARGVRNAIFTFADIPARLEPLDAPRVMRALDQADLVTVLSDPNLREDSPDGQAMVFLLANISQRMAGTLREEAEGAAAAKPRAAEAARGRIVAVIRALSDAGEITLLTPDDME